MSKINTSPDPAGRYRNHPITFRMTSGEKELFEKSFSESGFDTKQKYILSVICKKEMAPDRHIHLYFKILMLLEDIYRQLKGIGINVNQMARKANGTGILPSLKELSSTNDLLSEEVNTAWESIRYSLRELQRTQR